MPKVNDLRIRKYGEQELYIGGAIDKNSEEEMIEVGLEDAFGSANMWLNKKEVLRIGRHFAKLTKQIERYEKEKEESS